jgi:hypothetical protein
MATAATDTAGHGQGPLAIAPDHPDVAPDDDAVSNCSFKDLKDATPAEIEAHAPCGFKFMRGTRFPHLKGHIIPESMSSGSRSAQKVYFKDGRIVEADDSNSSSGGESVGSDMSDHKGDKDDAQVSRKRDREDAEEKDEAEASPSELPAYHTTCGMVPGSQWDGNGQCMCAACLGYLVSQESDAPDSDGNPEDEYKCPKKWMKEYKEFMATGKSTADWIAHLDAEKTKAAAAKADCKEKLEKYEAAVQEHARAYAHAD